MSKDNLEALTGVLHHRGLLGMRNFMRHSLLVFIGPNGSLSYAEIPMGVRI